jgi:hypothetical protein
MAAQKMVSGLTGSAMIDSCLGRRQLTELANHFDAAKGAEPGRIITACALLRQHHPRRPGRRSPSPTARAAAGEREDAGLKRR